MTNVTPFEVYGDGPFWIKAEVERLPEYIELFEQHGFEANGYCWAGHIMQILEKVNPELLSHIEFDPEAGGFYAYADSRQRQQQFVETLNPIFIDFKKLESYIVTADRDRIDD